MYLSPRVHFNCIWLFAKLLLLFSGLQNVLPRSYYFHLLPEGLKLLYIVKRFLHGCISPFVVKLHSDAYFWEFPLHNCSCKQKYRSYEHSWQRSEISPRKTLKHHLYETSQTLHCCLLILVCMGFTCGVYGCESLAPWWPLGRLLSLSISKSCLFWWWWWE